MQKNSLLNRIIYQVTKAAMALNRQYTLPHYMNTRWFTNGIKFNRYYERCRTNWHNDDDSLEEADSHRVDELETRGFTIIPPNTQMRELAAKIQERVETLISKPENRAEHNDPYRYILHSCVEHIPEVRTVLEGGVARFLESFYQSNFKVFEVEIYRNFPNEENQRQWMWHFDNDAYPVYKVFMYLTEVTTLEHGPIAIHSKQSTYDLFKSGFHNPYQPEGYLDTLSDPSRSHKVVAPAGTVVLFQNNCIHRAIPPMKEFRDVVSFMVQPSMEPWKEHFDRMGPSLCHCLRDPYNQPLDPARD